MAKIEFFEKVTNARFQDVPWYYGMSKRVLKSQGWNKLPENKETLEIKMVDDSGKIKVDLIITPFVRNCRKHRVKINCPGCGQFIPAGRIDQHNCKG